MNPAVSSGVSKTERSSPRISRLTVTKSRKGILLVLIRCPWFGGYIPQESRRVAGHDGIGRHVAGDDTTGSDHGILPDDDAREDRRPGPDRRPSPRQRGLDLPIILALEFRRGRRRPRI